MIIHWAWDDQFEDIVADGRLLGIASELLRAHRHGSHLLVLERRIADRLLTLELSQSDRALLARLGAEYTQTGGLHRSSPMYIALANTFERKIEAVASAVHVGLGAIHSTRILEVPVLLVENLSTDGWLIEQLLGVAALHAGRGAMAVDPQHGGGDDIHNVFRTLLQRKKLVVAVVDTDKNCPDGVANGKLDRLNAVLAANDWPMATAMSIPCRETENLISLDVLLAIPSAIGHATNTILLQIANVEAHGGVAADALFYSYFDIKLGSSSQSALKMAEPERDWVTQKIRLGGVAGDWDLPGYGSRVIHQIMADGTHIGRLREMVRSKQWSGSFASFFGFLFWYFISARRLVT